MALFGLLKDKCFYCRAAVDKGTEHREDVKVPGYVGTFSKTFCSTDHAEQYKQEIAEPRKSGGGGCCG